MKRRGATDTVRATSAEGAAFTHFSSRELPEAVAGALAAGREVSLCIKGRSMLPFLRETGDCVTLGALPSAGANRGDIVLGRTTDGRTVLHRVIGTTPEGDVTLAGDGNLYAREKARAADIVAAVHLRLRKGRATDMTSGRQLRLWWIWQALLPARRYLLLVYKAGERLGLIK